MKNIHDLNKIYNAVYTALYLTKTKKILIDNKVKNNTILRFTHFSKEPLHVCGIKHVIDILKNVKGNFKVYGVKDGDVVKAGEPILVIKGDYSAIAEYESVIDGLLARETSICNRTAKILSLIDTKQLIYMGDRADLYLTQPYDGYAAWIAGMRIFTTKGHVELIPNKKNVKVVGTMPHALIQQFNGNLSKALKAYHKTYPNDGLSALVDYHNNVVKEIKDLDRDLRSKIVSIRIDTSSSVIDKSLSQSKENKGVCPALVLKARKALDDNGMKHVKIVVSSGFDYEKIKKFINKKVPVDFYGVGSSIVKVDANITCDLVYLNGKKEAKFNRNLGISLKDLKKLNIYI